MTLFQATLPPVPPQAPGTELSVSGSLEDMAAVVLLLGVGLILATLIWPLIKAIARRIEGGSVSAEVQAELEGLRERVRQLEEMQPRMLELEERVDFAERIVAKGREPDRLER
jgi:aminoglycoside N3'-acetyltransferase